MLAFAVKWWRLRSAGNVWPHFTPPLLLHSLLSYANGKHLCWSLRQRNFSSPPSAWGHFRFEAAHMLVLCRIDAECKVDIERSCNSFSWGKMSLAMKIQNTPAYVLQYLSLQNKCLSYSFQIFYYYSVRNIKSQLFHYCCQFYFSSTGTKI